MGHSQPIAARVLIYVNKVYASQYYDMINGRLTIRILPFSLPLLGWLVVIFWLSSQSEPPGSDTMLTAQWFWGQTDLVAHFIEYSVLSIMFCIALFSLEGIRRTNYVYLGAALFCLAVGIADEVLQSSVPGRSSSFFDLVADVLGAISTLGVLVFVKMIYRRCQLPR